MIDLIDQVTYCTWFLKTSEKIASFILINSEQERSHLTKINQNWVRNSGLSRQDTALRSLTVFDWWGLGVARASGARGGHESTGPPGCNIQTSGTHWTAPWMRRESVRKFGPGIGGFRFKKKSYDGRFFFGYGVSYIVRYIYIVR